MTSEEIIAQLPYGDVFCFVDELTHLSLDKIEGNYRFKETEYFYKSHFKNNPITPGVILTECMAQIGLVCFGIYLMAEDTTALKIAMTSTDIEFIKPVYPKEQVKVKAKKMYYRFHKLKCEIKMYNEKDEIVAKGILAGMLIK